MPRKTKLKVTDLNPHLSCILCGGYFIDATTITECLHSFCRACIVRYLETSRYCPVCEVQVHKTRPLHYIRSDKTLQDIVYKIVPGLYQNEMKKRRELYSSQPPEARKLSRDAEDRGEDLEERFIYTPDEIFNFSLEYGYGENGPPDKKEEDEMEEMAKNDPKRRYLRCPAAVKVSHLKKFIRMKYGISITYQVDIRYQDESLDDEYTLMDVAYIYSWKRGDPMRLFYRILERPAKRLKTHHSYVSCDTLPAVDCEKQDEDTKADIKEEQDCLPSDPNPVPDVLKTEERKPEVAEPPATTSTDSKSDNTNSVDQSDTNAASENVIQDSATDAEDKTVVTPTSVSEVAPSEDKPESKPDETIAVIPEPCEASAVRTKPSTILSFTTPSFWTNPLSTISFTNRKKTKPSKKLKNVEPAKLKIIPVKIPEPDLKPTEEDRMDIDRDLEIRPLVIAESDPIPDEVEDEASVDSSSKNLPFPNSDLVDAKVVNGKQGKEEDTDDGEVDSGRGSDISSRAEARSLCGDDDIASPASSVRTPDLEKSFSLSVASPSSTSLPSPVTATLETTSAVNGSTTSTVSTVNGSSTPQPSTNDLGVLDLSTCHRKEGQERTPPSRPSYVPNPPVLDKNRQKSPCLPLPKHPSFKLLPAVLPHAALYKKPDLGSNRNFRCRGSTLTVINPDPNSCRPKIVIKNLDPRPDHGHSRHHHHHHHNHHHQRM